jgi:hypothetical protein
MTRCVALAALLSASSCFAQTARDYYNEVHAAGGLDRKVSQYVCFNDDPEAKAFFISAENKYFLERLISQGTFDKLSKAQQTEMKKDFLIFRGYDHGVPLASEDFARPDGTSWISDKLMLDKNTPARVRFSITWETMRYKRSVELLQSDDTLSTELPAYGNCELISTIGLPGNGPAAAAQMKVSDLYKLCTSSDETDKSACRFYILGVFEGADLVGSVGVQDRSGKFQEAKDKRFCIPEGLTGAAMELTVKTKMGQDIAVYPEDRDMPAISLVVGVIAQQFPCRKEK